MINVDQIENSVMTAFDFASQNTVYSNQSIRDPSGLRNVKEQAI
jgi:hypothetical protein